MVVSRCVLRSAMGVTLEKLSSDTETAAYMVTLPGAVAGLKFDNLADADRSYLKTIGARLAAPRMRAIDVKLAAQQGSVTLAPRGGL